MLRFPCTLDHSEGGPTAVETVADACSARDGLLFRAAPVQEWQHSE